jgi:hypothetical protein
MGVSYGPLTQMKEDSRKRKSATRIPFDPAKGDAKMPDVA